MVSAITEHSVRQFAKTISDQHHAMSGTIIAVAAAQAAALGEACIQISLDHQADKFDWQAINAYIKQMADIKNNLLEWGDRSVNAVDARLLMKNKPNGTVESRRILFTGPAEVGWLAVEAAIMLQDFRPLAHSEIQEDLEIAFRLLANNARAALYLLDSNLRLRGTDQLEREYGPIRSKLEMLLRQLFPEDETVHSSP